MWDRHRSTNNRYSGDNRLIALESSYRQRGLAPQNWGGPAVTLDMYWLITVKPNRRRVIPWEVLQNAKKR